MKHDNRFEDTDRDMSSFVLTCMHNGTRFFLSVGPGEPATDMLSRARRWRWHDQARSHAQQANSEPAWSHLKWEPMSVPAAIVATVERYLDYADCHCARCGKYATSFASTDPVPICHDCKEA